VFAKGATESEADRIGNTGTLNDLLAIGIAFEGRGQVHHAVTTANCTVCCFTVSADLVIP